MNNPRQRKYHISIVAENQDGEKHIQKVRVLYEKGRLVFEEHTSLTLLLGVNDYKIIDIT